MKYACAVSHWPQKILEAFTKKFSMWFEGEIGDGFQALPILGKRNPVSIRQRPGAADLSEYKVGGFSSPPSLGNMRV